MDRKGKLLVDGVGIVVLLSILAATKIGSTAEHVESTELAEGDGYGDSGEHESPFES